MGLRYQKLVPFSALRPEDPRDMQLRNARILISAGEASGEMYGAELLEVLRRRQPSLEFFGVGGERMRAAGCNTVVDSKDLAIVGIARWCIWRATRQLNAGESITMAKSGLWRSASAISRQKSR